MVVGGYLELNILVEGWEGEVTLCWNWVGSRWRSLLCQSVELGSAGQSLLTARIYLSMTSGIPLLSHLDGCCCYIFSLLFLIKLAFPKMLWKCYLQSVWSWLFFWVKALKICIWLRSRLEQHWQPCIVFVFLVAYVEGRGDGDISLGLQGLLNSYFWVR